MVKGLLALRLHFDIIGRDPPNDPKVQTQSKEPSNHEFFHAVINTSFERDNGDEAGISRYCSLKLSSATSSYSSITGGETMETTGTALQR